MNNKKQIYLFIGICLVVFLILSLIFIWPLSVKIRKSSAELTGIKKELAIIDDKTNGMENLKEMGLAETIIGKVQKDKIPILGICLGMQLFTKRSEEGRLPGFGWIDAETVRFKFGTNQTQLKIPHMGWNTINIKRESPLLSRMCFGDRFYFVHSYHVMYEENKNILATTNYGYEFTSIMQKENIFGVQFHPEKSHKFGMKLLKNFVENI